MATTDVRIDVHDLSQPGGSVAHQTETHAAGPAPRTAWDETLVPDEAGRTHRPDPDCPVETALAAVSGRWTTLVLRELMHGPHSFGGLRERLPRISAKVLAERLRVLQQRGLVAQERLNGFPVRTCYRLTAAGTALRPLLVELYRTGAALQSAGEGTGGPPPTRST